MNKDVIYIEPEDDITDILTGVKGSKAKVVALVPPKKAGVLKSAVNFKLLARTARETEKAVVLVTSDSALLKLAATAGIPVAKNLQTRPEVPTNAVPAEETEPESDVIDGEEAAAVTKSEKKAIKVDEESVVESVDLSEDGEAATEEEADDKKKSKKKKSAVPNFDKYRKFIIMGIVGVVLIVGLLLWALVFAPAATIMVTVRTTARSFSEAVSFTTNEAKEDSLGGVFLLDEQKVTKQSSVEFEATGEVDKGNKATGTLTLKRTTVNSIPLSAITVAKGTKFTQGGRVYITTEATELARLDSTNTSCTSTCSFTVPGVDTATVKVEAEVPGTESNTTSSLGWSGAGSGYSISGANVSGGTSKMVRVVSATDVAKAKEKLESVSAADGRAELLADFPVGLLPIAVSFRSETGDPVSTPAVGEEVGEDVTPKLVAKTTFVMYGVDRVRISEYIEERTKQAISGEAGQMVHSTGVSDNADENKAFIESFRELGEGFTGRLKSVAKVGPEVTDQMVMDKSLGRKIGEVQSLLKSINGVSKVQVETPFFWVSSIPDDINKVTVEITVE
ncbi:hypothetical protein FWF89_01230 [Candidatus Saccharibacteria bacterium]|nr:hypothetical protein [Candidatus Saccharibacteria bacterium]